MYNRDTAPVRFVPSPFHATDDALRHASASYPDFDRVSALRLCTPCATVNQSLYSTPFYVLTSATRCTRCGTVE